MSITYQSAEVQLPGLWKLRGKPSETEWNLRSLEKAPNQIFVHVHAFSVSQPVKAKPTLRRWCGDLAVFSSKSKRWKLCETRQSKCPTPTRCFVKAYAGCHGQESNSWAGHDKLEPVLVRHMLERESQQMSGFVLLGFKAVFQSDPINAYHI